MTTTIAAALFRDLPLGPAELAWLFIVNIFGSMPFCALGLFIGTLATAKSAPGFLNLIYLPMIYLSGFLFPLPPAMQWIAFGSPAFHLHQLALTAIGAPSQAPPSIHALLLAGLTVGLTVVAVRRLARVG